MQLLFDYKKALNDEEEDKGVFSMNKLFIGLQLAYIRKDTEAIEALENVFDAYHKNPKKDKIKLIYINPENQFWSFIDIDIEN